MGQGREEIGQKEVPGDDEFLLLDSACKSYKFQRWKGLVCLLALSLKWGWAKRGRKLDRREVPGDDEFLLLDFACKSYKFQRWKGLVCVFCALSEMGNKVECFEVLCTADASMYFSVPEVGMGQGREEIGQKEVPGDNEFLLLDSACKSYKFQRWKGLVCRLERSLKWVISCTPRNGVRNPNPIPESPIFRTNLGKALKKTAICNHVRWLRFRTGGRLQNFSFDGEFGNGICCFRFSK
ncbi:hypothetical protein CEXT_267601 [Caerostris extrusa]|uniref:Uncharacterized protein n=1 Tax=Caerostris extrusa TaxID=172846 RepID=A0AAV4UKZ4_CAEEX|nr:hypothetical protein CEXT_267601 [Caerostris extrusa]